MKEISKKSLRMKKIKVRDYEKKIKLDRVRSI